MQFTDEQIRAFIAQNTLNEQQLLGPYAFPSAKAIRKRVETENYRSPFTRDADRILHSFSFARFFDKTQVFFWVKSDLHSHRMLHVQLVSKIAREIAHILRLNEYLTEAIALGHDIGHVPFGHDGEYELNKLCVKHGIGEFHHNYESVWFLQEVEMQNLTLPVIDSILCHNGESHYNILTPKLENLTWEFHGKEMNDLLKGKNRDPIPKTLEGCLVRIADTISYISRDVMDAENLGFLKFDDIPDTVKDRLGKTNREIINSLITDVIANSLNKNQIGYSEDIYSALQDLYQFNYKNIYTHQNKMRHQPVICDAFHLLWDHYYDDLINDRKESKIFLDHLYFNLKQIRTRLPEINSLEKYPYARQPPEIIVRDFLAGMTDQYFWQLANELGPQLRFEPDEIY
jgi:dGTPase